MRFNFYSPVHFEKWDWRNSVERGIGGSETCHVEMAWRLARRGHEVYSYAPLPRDTRDGARWRGTTWARLERWDPDAPGIHVIFRNAECLDRMDKRTDQQIWLVCQDEVPIGLNEERAAKIDKVLAYCQWHGRHMTRHLGKLVRDKIVVTSNGLKTDLLRQVEARCVPGRDPYRLMFASSPDRGLVQLLQIFRRAREFEPKLNLHIFYGVDNIKKLLKFNPRFGRYRGFLDELKAGLDQPNVTWHGRVSQVELYREWLKTGLWVYPTNFTETSCITCMEAQALGAVPIFSPRAALAENVIGGVPIEGDPADDSTGATVRDRFVNEIVRLTWHPVIQEDHRRQIIGPARARFAWDRQVDQWEGWLYGWAGRFGVAQFAFQLKHAEGRVLNVGCADDPAGFGRHGGVNLDAMAEIPWSKKPTAAHVIHDARRPLPKAIGKFDSVVLGDILEHLADADAVRILRNAKAVLNKGGLVVITCPEDHRPVGQQHDKAGHRYPTGESAYHERPVTRGVIRGWLAKAGLRRKLGYELDYAHCSGHGVVAVRR